MSSWVGIEEKEMGFDRNLKRREHLDTKILEGLEKKGMNQGREGY